MTRTSRVLAPNDSAADKPVSDEIVKGHARQRRPSARNFEITPEDFVELLIHSSKVALNICILLHMTDLRINMRYGLQRASMTVNGKFRLVSACACIRDHARNGHFRLTSKDSQR